MPDDDESPWPPAMFANPFQEAGEEAMKQQAEMAKRMFSAGTGSGFGMSQLDAMSRSMAAFKTRVQSGGRISIPDAEREALDIEEGDIVQTVVIPIKRNQE
ncbi:MAG: AbrB/MazE/SpoVT family DNA-binding domain-containing protein [Halobacteriales archaeon]